MIAMLDRLPIVIGNNPTYLRWGWAIGIRTIVLTTKFRFGTKCRIIETSLENGK